MGTDWLIKQTAIQNKVSVRFRTLDYRSIILTAKGLQQVDECSFKNLESPCKCPVSVYNKDRAKSFGKIIRKKHKDLRMANLCQAKLF